MDYSRYGIEDFVCDESFQAYCTGANPAQVLFWEEYAQLHPGQAAVLEEARLLVQVLTARQGNRLDQLQQLRQGMLQQAKLQALLGGQHEMVTPAAHASHDGITPAAHAIPEHLPAATDRRTPRLIWLSAAAAAILSFIIITFTTHNAHNNTPAVATVFTAGSLPRKTVLLPDGSVITLRAQSKVTLDTGFNHSNRFLTLEGEAFFDVQHAAARPFVVHTPQADITVLGTRFNVSAYPGKATETALYRGQVAIQAQGAAPVLLSAHEKLVIGNTPAATPAQHKPHATPLQMPGHGATAENAWVHNRLEIENEPLKDIAARLEKWYGIHIVIQDGDVQQYRYSGTFESENIVEALQALQLSYHFNFTADHDQIVIEK